MNKVHFSSKSIEHGTPMEIFQKLDDEFKFTLDVCASKLNFKCKQYFTQEDNALAQKWAPNTCFMNPPYAKREKKCNSLCVKKRCSDRGYHITSDLPGIEDWIAKAKQESENGATVVCLLPARTDTWWHRYVWNPDTHTWYDGVEVRFIKGRLKFTGLATASAPFPSVLVIFRPPC